MTGHDRLTIGMYSFDCRDAAALARFWSRMLERPVDQGATAAYATIGFADEGRRGCSSGPTTRPRAVTG